MLHNIILCLSSWKLFLFLDIMWLNGTDGEKEKFELLLLGLISKAHFIRLPSYTTLLNTMKIRQCENKSKEKFNRISKQISNHVFFLSTYQKLSKNNNFLNQSDRNVGYLQNYEREHLENWQQINENKQWPEMFSFEGSYYV